MAPTGQRMIVTAAAGIALLLTSAGACGPTEPGDDEPAVSTQQPGGEPSPDDAEPDDAGTDDAGPADGGADDPGADDDGTDAGTDDEGADGDTDDGADVGG